MRLHLQHYSNLSEFSKIVKMLCEKKRRSSSFVYTQERAANAKNANFLSLKRLQTHTPLELSSVHLTGEEENVFVMQHTHSSPSVYLLIWIAREFQEPASSASQLFHVKLYQLVE